METMRLQGCAVCLLASLVLAGCQGGSAGGTGSGGSIVSATGKKLKIGVSVPDADHGWTAGVIYWAKQAMALYPDVEWSFQTAGTADKQIKDLETMETQGEDAIVVLATESAPITPTAEEIHKRGILLVNVDRGFLKPVADVFLEGDNKSFGRKSAEYMAQKLGGKGQIVILEGIPSTVNTDRVNAAKEVFKGYPGIQILDDQSGMWNRQKALDVMQTMLLKNKHIDAVWAQDDDMALGAEQAIKEAGRQNEMWILGGAGMKDIVKRVMDGDKMFPADITYPPSMVADAIQTTVSILRDGKKDKILQFTPRHTMIDVEMITPDNAKDFYFPDSTF
ncbi:MAG TPA: ABC transporter substrate-binding protein [Fimbriimonadaceae bacterium]|nr:ABC transporter substrate-binding protein [Fimbriimonadaceae bacterium]